MVISASKKEMTIMGSNIFTSNLIQTAYIQNFAAK